VGCQETIGSVSNKRLQPLVNTDQSYPPPLKPGMEISYIQINQ
jgi:hypothetical protein